MAESGVYPIWTVDEKHSISYTKTNKFLETLQKMRIQVKSLRKSEVKQIKSPDLHFKFLDNSFWYLTIEPRVVKDESNKDYYIGLFLHLKVKNPFERFGGQIASVKISVIDPNRNKVWSKKSPMLYFNGEPGWGWKHFVKRDELFQDCMRSLDIVICVCITSIQLKDLEHKESPHLKIDNCGGDSGRKADKLAFVHDLMNDKEFCDIHLVVGDTDFALHSRVLAAMSSTFDRLIRKQKESMSREICLLDVDENVFHELVLFIYNGFSPNIATHCKQLLVMAHKYNIRRLKSICDNLCFRDLKPDETAIDSIVFANKYKTFSARVRVFCFIANNLNRLTDLLGDKWKSFVKENEGLAKEVERIEKMKCLCLQHRSSD